MYRTDGHQLVVNEYYKECLRKAQAREAERDEAVTSRQDPDSSASTARLPEEPAPRP